MGSIKEVLSIWTSKKQLKEMTKDEKCNTLYGQLDDITNFFLFKRFKEKDNLQKLYNVLAEPKFVKVLSKVVKDARDEYAPDAAICLVLSDFVNSRADSLTEEMIDRYKSIMMTLLKPTVKKMKKITGLDENTCLSIVAVVPSKDMIKNQKYVGRYIQNVQSVICKYCSSDMVDNDGKYNGVDVDDFTEKTVKNIIKLLFKKEYKNAILLSIALDKKHIVSSYNENQKKVWNAFTSYMLKELNKMEKDEIIELLKHYVGVRVRDTKDGRDSARRIIFTHLPEDENKSIVKAAKKIIKKDKKDVACKYL